MRLTLKQENFCLAYIETGNASEAYRRAFNTERMKPETVNRSAKELLDNPKITARLEYLRRPVVEAAQFTLEKHLNTLADLRDQAADEGKYGPAIQAEIARGKASGFYSSSTMTGRNELESLTDEELECRLKETERAIAYAKGVIDMASKASNHQ